MVALQLNIWDTTALDTSQSVAAEYCKGALGAVFVYNMAATKSFDFIASRIQQLEAVRDKNTHFQLVGHCLEQMDAEQQPAISRTAEEFAEKHAMLHSKVESHDAGNVRSMWRRMAERIYYVDKTLRKSPQKRVEFGWEPPKTRHKKKKRRRDSSKRMVKRLRSKRRLRKRQQHGHLEANGQYGPTESSDGSDTADTDGSDTADTDRDHDPEHGQVADEMVVSPLSVMSPNSEQVENVQRFIVGNQLNAVSSVGDEVELKLDPEALSSVSPRKMKESLVVELPARHEHVSAVEAAEMVDRMEKERVTTNAVIQLHKFMIQIGMEEYFEALRKADCDISYLEDFDDHSHETLKEDLGMASILKRKKFLRECAKFSEEMKDLEARMREHHISVLTAKRLQKFGILTMAILAEEIEQKSDLWMKYGIADQKQCNLLWKMIRIELNPQLQRQNSGCGGFFPFCASI